MSTKISQLTSAVDVTANDLIQIVDVEDGVMAPSGTNKKATASLLANQLVPLINAGAIAGSKIADSGITSAKIANDTIVNADINSSAAIAGTKISPDFGSQNIITTGTLSANVGSVISGSSASDGLRITQTGSGNALVVEDFTNPDATPFVVNPNGKVISGSTLAKTFRNIYTGGQLTPRIQIQGDIGDEACSVIFHSQDNVASGFTGFARSRGTLVAPAALQNGDYIGLETYQAYDGAEFLEAGRIVSIVDNNVSIGDVSAAIVFSTNPPGTATIVEERMRITSAGNVGIGTNSPEVALQVNKATDPSVRVFETGSSVDTRITSLAAAGIIGTYSNHPTVFHANAAERMRITSSGNVGIGTSSPADRLTVNSASSEFAIQWSGPGNEWVLASAANRSYIRNKTAGVETLTILNAGNVGIGTSSPSYQLQLSTDSAAKPSTSTWTVSSDERLKENIEAADLDICYNAVKSIPLKRYKWKDEIYSAEQVADRNKIGWIAQDVQAIFPKAVGQHKFVYNQVKDEEGNIVSEDSIDDCLSLNSDQLYAALFGAVQKLMGEVESLQDRIAELESAP